MSKTQKKTTRQEKLEKDLKILNKFKIVYFLCKLNPEINSKKKCVYNEYKKLKKSQFQNK